MSVFARTPPIVIWAEQIIDEYETASPARRAMLDKRHPGRVAAAREVRLVWSHPTPPERDLTADERAACVARVMAKGA